MIPENSALISDLRADLLRAQFDVLGLEELWGDDAAKALERNQRVPAVRALAVQRSRPGLSEQTESLAVLAELFVLGLTVPREKLQRAVPTVTVAGLIALGLVESDATETRLAPLCELKPHRFVDGEHECELLLRADLGETALGAPVAENHVLGIGGASRTLASIMLKKQYDRVLDIGTGCGVLALIASKHARSVVATDISERALVIAEFNAVLNDIHSVEFRLGSLFDPIDVSETFDLIVSNPPFVITPRTREVPAYDYRDGGLEGDRLVEAVIRGVGHHLAQDGVAQLLGNWESHRAASGATRIAHWLDSAGSDLEWWVVERETIGIDRYAETWIRDGGIKVGTSEFDHLYDAWLNDFESRGVTEVTFGYVLIRKPGAITARPLRRVEKAPATGSASLSEHLADSLERHRWQSERDDAAIAATHFLVSQDVTIEHHLLPGNDDPSVILLRQGGGFARSESIDSGQAAFIGACDGELSAGVIIAAIAQLLDVSESELAAELYGYIRECLVRGYIDPLDDESYLGE